MVGRPVPAVNILDGASRSVMHAVTAASRGLLCLLSLVHAGRHFRAGIRRFFSSLFAEWSVGARETFSDKANEEGSLPLSLSATLPVRSILAKGRSFLMGYNRSGKKRTDRLKRAKREVARLLRKQAATAQPTSNPPPTPAAAAATEAKS
jgi:hypothetical protein